MGIFDRREPEDSFAPGFSAAKFNAPRPLTASAARLNLGNKKEIDALAQRRVSDKWQEEAWEYYDLIGEIRNAANLIAQVLSRVNLYPAYIENTQNVPVGIDSVTELDDDFKTSTKSALYLLESGNGGTSGLLRSAALNLFIVGECYLVREPAKYSTGEPEKYQIRSIDELVKTSVKRRSTVAIRPRKDARQEDYIAIPENGYVCRLWRNHPRFSDEADSSVRGILEICDELLLLSRASSATAKSRLNAGMLFVPDGLSNISESDGDFTEGTEEMADLSDDEEMSFEEELIQAMTLPIQDSSSASSVVPLVVRGPEELGEKIRFLQFERSYDPQLAARAQNALDRILAGLDIPSDVAKGLSGVKYSNALLIEEQLFKAHVEPMILLIVDALTVGFLRPALRSLGYDEEQVSRAVIWYDPTAITAKPSKAEAAVTLYELGAIGHPALRRANGFAESDAPTPDEIAQRIAKEKGLVSEPLTEKIFAKMMPDLMGELRQEQLAQSDADSASALSQALDPNSTSPDPGSNITEEPPAAGGETPTTLMEP